MVLGLLFLIEGTAKGFGDIKFLYAYYYEPTSFVKDEMTLESSEEQATIEATGANPMWFYYGELINSKEKTRILVDKNSLTRTKEGNILVWRYKYKNKSRTFYRKQQEQFPSFRVTYGSWFSFISTILFLPALLYYIFLKIEDKKKLKNNSKKQLQ